MRIKKFIAPSLQAGKFKIQDELGDEAVILSNRTIRDPKDPTKTMIEIVAAIDETPVKNEQKKVPDVIAPLLARSNKSIKDIDETNTRTNNKIQEQLNTLQQMLADLNLDIKHNYLTSMPSLYKNIFNKLLENNITEELSRYVAKSLSNHSMMLNPIESVTEARRLITEHITALAPPKMGKTCKMIMFVGPTGTGKTFSLVKLAIIFKMVMEANVAIVSADTVKVGGADQLNTFAEIADIPCESVYNTDDLDDVLAEYDDRDFVLIDTTGRSQKDGKHLLELRDYVSVTRPDYLYLVVSATTERATLEEIIREYSALGPHAIILSKVDESASIGSIISALKNVNMPIAYTTYGQGIPDDIEPVDIDKMARMVLPDDIIDTVGEE